MNKSHNYKATIDWYERNAEEYARKINKFPKIDFKQLNKFASLLPKSCLILDAGCGSGRDTNLFFEKGFNVIGIDLSRNLIAHAKTNYLNCNFEQGDILNLRFPNEYFDAVWAHASLIHFDNIEQFKRSLNELSRVLKDYGFIHILVRAKTDNLKLDSFSSGERHYLNFTTDQLKLLLEKSKFEILELKQYNENDLDPDKRPGEGVEWILAVAKKLF